MKKIWGSLLFAKTNWQVSEEIEEFIKESKNIEVKKETYDQTISLFEQTYFDLHQRVSSFTDNGKPLTEDLFGKFMELSYEEAIHLYGPIFLKEINEELNFILKQEVFEEFVPTEGKMVRVGENDYKHANQVILDLLSSKLAQIHYTVSWKVKAGYRAKYHIEPSIYTLEQYLYYNLIDYLKENDIPIRCSYCQKVIESPSKLQLTKAQKREDVFHKVCFDKNRKEKDRMRKKEKRKKK